MLDIWNSWRISGKLIGERIEAAARSMREAGHVNIPTKPGTLLCASTTLLRICGTTGEIDTLESQRVVDELNRRERASRWRVVPMTEY
jgi:hypothetical protein